MIVPENLYKEHDLNDELGLAGIVRFRAAVASGELPNAKVDNQTFVKGADLIAWLTKPAETPKAAPAPAETKPVLPAAK